MNRCLLSFWLVTGLLASSGCKQADREVDRTAGQLTKVAKDVGAENLVSAVADSYKSNIAPTVKDTREYLEQYEQMKELQKLSKQATENLREFGEDVSRKGSSLFSAFPESDRELLSMIDGYNRDFTRWLGTETEFKTSLKGSKKKSRRH